MKGKNVKGSRIVQYLLAAMVIGSFLFFLLGEALLPPENSFDNDIVNAFSADWVQVLPDGTEETITVPGQCEAEYAEWVTIKTSLAKEQEEVWICIRSMQQDINIYVGNELRREYSTLDTQLFGKTSTMTYVMFPLYEEDAGKELRIELMSDSSSSGYISEILAGEKFDILQHFYSLYMPAVVVATLLLLLGLFVVGGSIFLRVFYKKKVEIIHLGNTIIIAASWLIVESKMRQFLLPNTTIAMMTGFLLIAMLPYPFAAYINSTQKKRYNRIYVLIEGCTAINFVAVVTLQVMNIKDFYETMTSSHLIIIGLIITMGVTIVMDIRRGYIREYREVAIGFAGLMLAGVFEIALVYMVAAKVNGIALSMGLVLLLVAAGLKSVRDLVNIEKEKQYAIATSESKAKFLANMSHEIRTPINTIIGMNEMILRENESDVIGEYAENIESASHMLLGLINDVLDYSKIEAGKLQIVEKQYHLARVLKDVIIGIELRAKQKNLEVYVDIDSRIPAILQGDEIRIKQILNNLLSNAIKYTEKGSITFTATSVRDEKGFCLVFSVKDTGIGIKEEDQEKLFHSFQRLELEKNRYIEGTGLGLNITKFLVDLMNGTIEVQSEYGVGSCFTVRLPQQVMDEMPMGDLKAATKLEAKAKESNGGQLQIPDAKILVVDDTSMNLKVIRGLLKRTLAQIDMAGGGNECLDMTRQKKYDIILMDHMMPEPDGIQTFHMIRDEEHNLNRDTPIIVMTANAIEGMKEQYLEEGFSDYLSKPVEPDKLEAMLKRFMA